VGGKGRRGEGGAGRKKGMDEREGDCGTPALHLGRWTPCLQIA
jgi:hypothetical protein